MAGGLVIASIGVYSGGAVAQLLVEPLVRYCLYYVVRLVTYTVKDERGRWSIFRPNTPWLQRHHLTFFQNSLIWSEAPILIIEQSIQIRDADYPRIIILEMIL